MSTVWRWKNGLYLGISLWSLYALSATATLSSVDEGHIFQTAAALAERGTTRYETPLSDRYYSRFSLLPSLPLVPAYIIVDRLLPLATATSAPALAWRNHWLHYATNVSAAALLAVSAVLLAQWLMQLGYATATAFSVAWLYGLGSMIWPYSSTIFPQIITTLLVVWFTSRLTSAGTGWSGVLWSLLLWARLQWILLLPVPLFYLWQQGRRRALIALLVGTGAGVFVTGLTNVLRGDAFIAGGYEGETFTTPLAVGLLGLLTSAGKGLLLHAPIALLGLCLLPWFAHTRPELAKLLTGLVTLHFLVMSRWWAWHGAMSWGPRLLLPILPLLMVPVAAWCDRWSDQPLPLRRAFLGVALLACCLNAWAITQPRVGYIDAVRWTNINEIEQIFIPNVGPWGIETQGNPAWLWQSEPSNYSLLPKRIFILLFSTLLIGSVWQCLNLLQRECPEWKQTLGLNWRHLGRSLILVVLFAAGLPASWQWLASNATEPTDKSALAIPNQLRHLAPLALANSTTTTATTQAEQLIGRIWLPLRGKYGWHNDLVHPLEIQIAGQQVVWSDQGEGQIQALAGLHEIRLRRLTEQWSPLRWSIPGGGQFKQPVPADYLFAPAGPNQARTDFWQEQRLLIRHLGWLFWIPALVLLIHWGLTPARFSSGTVKPVNN